MMMSRPTHIALATLSIAMGLALPLAALAQSSALEATIRAELLKDPRSVEMSEAELDAMVQLLAQGAAQEGVSSDEISWRPAEATPAMVVEEETSATCDGFPQFFCTVREALGFDGSNLIIPMGLFVTSGLLWFLLYELRHHHRMGFE